MSLHAYVDQHGFLSKKPIAEERRSVERVNKWQEMLRRWDYMKRSRSHVIKRRVRKGIPDCFRSTVWRDIAGIEVLKETQSPNLYQRLSEQDVLVKVGKDIEKDLDRTFPNHVIFREELGRLALGRVLRAYANYDPEIGYCQGMGFLSGLLLLYLSEEDVFWALSSLMNTYHMKDMFTIGMRGVRRASYVSNELVKYHLPALSRHFAAIDFYPNFVVPQWFMTLYITSFNFEAVLSIWDIFLNEGQKALYRVMLAAFKLAEKDLLRKNCGDCLTFMREFTSQIEAELLIKTAFKISLRTKTIRIHEIQFDATEQ